MLTRKKTADELVNLIEIILNHYNLTKEEQKKLIDEVSTIYQNIIKELYTIEL